MKQARLIRNFSSDQGTLGVLSADGFKCVILEPPWRDNKQNISCIPAGAYECVRINSSTFGPCFWIKNVPARTGILFHCGNVAGDRKKGYQTDSLGCLLLGSYTGRLLGQIAVLASRRARGEFLDFFGADSFELKIEEMFKK